MNDSERAISEEKATFDDGELRRTRTTPLPWAQLCIIYLIQFSEPVTATVIYPFISQFVRDTGITGGDDRKTGYFAGIIESTFFFTEAITVIAWGMASDRFGRRPVLLWGPLGLALAMLGFGMSTTFWWLLFFRCLQGMFNGNIGVAKAVIGELTDSTNIADAFAVLPFMWSTGEILGPTIGGLLSRPADSWPHTLGQLEFLRSHPYFLPCFAASTISFSSFLCGLFMLKETSAFMKQKIEQRGRKPEMTASAQDLASVLITDYDVTSGRRLSEISYRRSSIADQECKQTQTSGDDLKPPILRALLTRDVVAVLMNAGLFTFSSTAATVLIPLVWSTSPEHGGYGFTPYRIGITLGVYGVLNALVQLKFLSTIIKFFGPQRVYTASCLGQLLHFSCYILGGFFSRRAGGADWRVWCVIAVQLFAEMMNYAAYGSMHIMIQGVSPSKSALGTMNGLAQALTSVARSFAPLFASSLYAMSLQRDLAGGNAVYYIMLVLVACFMPVTFLLPQKLRLD